MALVDRHVRNCKNSSYFLNFAKDVTSQGGEDGIIAELFNLLPVRQLDGIDNGDVTDQLLLQPEHTTSSPNIPTQRMLQLGDIAFAQGRRFCVDVGAWDGKHLSNTYNLLHNESDWDGILFEANADRVNDLKTLYDDKESGSKRTKCVECLVDFCGKNSLSRLLASFHVPRDFDFLSIDVDGNDYHIWASLGHSQSCPLNRYEDRSPRDNLMLPICSCLERSTFRPSVVCIEFNPTIPNDVVFIQEADMRVHQGSSLRSLVQLGSSLGYSFVASTTFNAFFVRTDLLVYLPLEALPPSVSSVQSHIDNLHAANMTTLMFQTYDGEIKFVGPKKLLWHRKAINPQRLQVLSKRDRKFPFAPPFDDQLHFMYRNIARLASYVLTKISNKGVVMKGSHDRLFIDGLMSLFFDAVSTCCDLLVVSHLHDLVVQAIVHTAYLVYFKTHVRHRSNFPFVEMNARSTPFKVLTCVSVSEFMVVVFESHPSGCDLNLFVSQSLYMLGAVLFQRGVKLLFTSPEISKELFLQALALLSLASQTCRGSSKGCGHVVRWEDVTYDCSVSCLDNVLALRYVVLRQLCSLLAAGLKEADSTGAEALLWSSMLEGNTSSTSTPSLRGHSNEVMDRVRSKLVKFVEERLSIFMTRDMCDDDTGDTSTRQGRQKLIVNMLNRHDDVPTPGTIEMGGFMRTNTYQEIFLFVGLGVVMGAGLTSLAFRFGVTGSCPAFR